MGGVTMPYVHISTTKPLTKNEKEELSEKVAALMPLLPGKSRDNTMIQIDDGCFIRMGDKKECVMIDMRVYKASPEENKKEYSEKLMAMLEEELGIPLANIYFNITEMEHWASRGNYR